MARPTREEIETFMSITGASESLALRKLEEFGGNLTAAVNAHYRELQAQITNPGVYPRYNTMDMNNHIQGGSRGILPLLSAARSFRPSLLLDSNYRRNLINQFGVSAFASPTSFSSHTGDFNNGNMQYYHSGPRPVFEDVTGTSSSHGPVYNENVLRNDEGHRNGNDVEDEMVQAAIEASKRDFENSSGRGLEDEEFARALSLSLKTAEQEEVMRVQTVDDQFRQLGVYDSSRRAESTNSGRLKLKPGSSLTQAGAEGVVERPPHESSKEWGGISFKELNEAMMLEAAFFPQMSERSSSYTQNGLDNSMSSDKQPVRSSPSPSIAAERLLREQQDEEYLASLLSDREKEANSLKETKTHHLKEKGFCREVQQPERCLATKEVSLPEEPAVDDGNAVTLLIRMPDGSRHGRRFLKSDKLQFLFDFVDVCGAVKPGTYRVVRPYPRRAFNVGESSLSLNELGLTNKQEALFLELI